jgi:CheY-like chemotaxis protein
VNRPCAILLLEDDPKEIELVSQALSKLARKTILTVARTVGEAEKFINESAVPPSQSAPDIVLVDLRLATGSGMQFIAWCKSNPRLPRIHIIVFSASNSPKDRAEAFKLGASAFENKPLTFEELTQKLSRILAEWCD